ncbi:MAG: SEC-C domain-containing protein [Candidatus Sericytochromatia bacterium]|nr:SEC-C domain-containing protein [Candidatus Sericytochromatia bacterium]
MRNAGLLGEMPGIPMTQMLDEGTRIRPLRVFTGVLAAVVFIDNKDTLMPIEHWVLPLAQQLALENLIQDTFGTAGDAVSVCTFPFQPADFRPLGVESILTDNFAAGALRTADTDFDVPFRQSLLRRSPPSRIWAMPDGQLAMPIFLPVTVMSILSPYYWEHGRDDEQATADQLGLILAAGLAERELLGCEIEVYCGHLHVSDDLDTVMRDITMDLTERGGQLRLYPHRNPPKVGRNLACPCGSGLKYKKCCAN